MMSFFKKEVNKTAKDLISDFNTYAKEYPIVAGAVSLWCLTTLSLMLKSLPNKIWEITKKQTTTTLTLTSSSIAFHRFLRWCEKNKITKNIRSLKISCGKYGTAKARKSIGYGTHYFFKKGRIFKINMRQDDKTTNDMERDIIDITILGRSHSFFDKLFDEINKDESRKDVVEVKQFVDDYWQDCEDQRKRDINTVHINKKSKEKIINHIENFIKRENWYLKNGLSYQTGILLYGLPGSGKTSLIKALSSKYNKPLYILGANNLHYIEKAIVRLPENSILLIEDIDSDSATHSRDNPKPVKNMKPTSKQIPIDFSISSISSILNSIDGIISNHGRILIATTNYKNKLDEALLRDGRFDLKIKLGNVDIDILKGFFKQYYSGFKIDKNIQLKKDITPAKLQNIILNNLNEPEDVIKEIIKK